MQIIIDDKLFKPKKPESEPIDLKPLFEYLSTVEIHPTFGFALFGWGVLGFYRGCRYHSWCYKRDLKIYERKSNKNKGKKPQQMYFMTGAFGLLTSFLYYVPLINLSYISKELWRLETYLRGIEVNTDSEEYNKLFIM
jgi:hypothetical protein